MKTKLITLIFDSQMDYTPIIGNAIRAICAVMPIDETTLYQLELCAVEGINNVITHAYNMEPGHEVEIEITLESKQITFSIYDSGITCQNFNEKSELIYDPNDISTIPETGMGIFFIQQFMDEVIYSESLGQNVTTMRKQLK